MSANLRNTIYKCAHGHEVTLQQVLDAISLLENAEVIEELDQISLIRRLKKFRKIKKKQTSVH